MVGFFFSPSNFYSWNFDPLSLQFYLLFLMDFLPLLYCFCRLADLDVIENIFSIINNSLLFHFLSNAFCRQEAPNCLTVLNLPVWASQLSIYQRHLVILWKPCLREKLQVLFPEAAGLEQAFQWRERPTRRKKDLSVSLKKQFLMSLYYCMCLFLYFWTYTPETAC